MKEALYYSALDNEDVQCELCPHNCRIAPGKRGVCAVRANVEGKLYSLSWGNLAAAHLDPMEKKPLYHFYPGSRAFSVATEGCNLSCPFCQNSDLSVGCREKTVISGQKREPKQVVEMALDAGASTLCFTYSEPTVFYEYMLEMARIAKERGLKTAIVSNGYINPKPLEQLIPWLDAANIDLKAFSLDTYRKVLKGSLQQVQDNILALWEERVWLEVTTLVVPDLNDSPEELELIARFLEQTDPDIPWHVSRFHPAWRMSQGPPTPVQSIETALHIGRQAGLRYVYPGNLRTSEEDSTQCPHCGERVITRDGFFVTEYKLRPGGICPSCGVRLGGRFE
ncbi:AmmeMemoRadiSam system radical SAM enzyme [bacterium]|nr:AmmeMemoRadiSam system radical SAM enzyme [bacterium]